MSLNVCLFFSVRHFGLYFSKNSIPKFKITRKIYSKNLIARRDDFKSPVSGCMAHTWLIYIWVTLILRLNPRLDKTAIYTSEPHVSQFEILFLQTFFSIFLKFSRMLRTLRRALSSSAVRQDKFHPRTQSEFVNDLQGDHIIQNWNFSTKYLLRF